MTKFPVNPLLDAMRELREVSETRISHRTYVELLITTYHKAMSNMLVEKGLISGEDLYDGMNKYFNEAAEEVKKLPMKSPIQP